MTRSRNERRTWSTPWVSGHVAAQIDEGVAQLFDQVADVAAQGDEVGLDGPAVIELHQAVDLEAQVDDGLADVVVQLAGQAGPLLLHPQAVDALEPSGVVEGQRRGAGQVADAPLVGRR